MTEWCILAAAILLVVDTWLVAGLAVPARVTSGSMAETLLGPHREVVCDDCGHRYVCGADSKPAGSRTICPNCGFVGNDLGRQPHLDGDRLLIDKSAFRFRPPRRWQIAAFRRPSHAGEIHVKRVVGLPGESVQIRDGNVYVDGQIQRKTLPEQGAMAILVHDANAWPTLAPLPPPCWQGESDDTGWGSADGRFAHPSAAGRDDAEDEPIDWLVYRHWQPVPPDVPLRMPASGRSDASEAAAKATASAQVRFREVPITDVCSYNQGWPRRHEDIHPVNELLVSLKLVKTLGPGGRLIVRATDRRDEFLTRIDPGRSRYEVLHNGRPVPAAAGKLPEPIQGRTIVVSLFDQQYLLAIDGQTIVCWPYIPQQQDASPAAHPLAIGSQGLGMVVGDLRIFRDIYYTHPIGPQGRWALSAPVQLGDGQYFVLGDNSPISQDSRCWPDGPAVEDRLLVGRPFLVHFPAQQVYWGDWRFQVPDPSRIRYIR